MTTQNTGSMKSEALARAEKEFGTAWLKPIAPYFPPSEAGETMEEHSIKRWIIARSQPNQEAAAVVSLERMGFEAWFPEGRFVRTIPLRKLPSKTRHKRVLEEAIETRRNAYPGYVFARRMFGNFDVCSFFELTGVAGVCCFGNVIATIADLELECMRLASASGTFDRYSSVAAERIFKYQLAKGFTGEKRYVGESKLLGRTCDSGHFVQFLKTLDRVTRVITALPSSDATRQQGTTLMVSNGGA